MKSQSSSLKSADIIKADSKSDNIEKHEANSCKSIKIGLSTNKTTEESLICEHCQKLFNTSTELDQHIITSHTKVIDINTDTQILNNKSTDNTFSSNSQQENSKLNNINNNKSPMDTFCTICKKEVCNKYFLKTHLMNKHGVQIEDYLNAANSAAVAASAAASAIAAAASSTSSSSTIPSSSSSSSSSSTDSQKIASFLNRSISNSKVNAAAAVMANFYQSDENDYTNNKRYIS